MAFKGIYHKETILKWLKHSTEDSSQQFKRSCLPDGPKVGTEAVSPRGDLVNAKDGCKRMDEPVGKHRVVEELWCEIIVMIYYTSVGRSCHIEKELAYPETIQYHILK